MGIIETTKAFRRRVHLETVVIAAVVGLIGGLVGAWWLKESSPISPAPPPVAVTPALDVAPIQPIPVAAVVPDPPPSAAFDPDDYESTARWVGSLYAAMIPQLAIMRSQVESDRARGIATGRGRVVWDQARQAGLSIPEDRATVRWRVKVAQSGPAGILIDAGRAIFPDKAADPNSVIEVGLYIAHPEIPGPRRDQDEEIQEAVAAERAALQEGKSRLLSIGYHIDKAKANSLSRGDEIMIRGKVGALVCDPRNYADDMPRSVRLWLKDARAE